MTEMLKPYPQTHAEQETIIRWDREDPQAHIDSANPAVWRKLARLGIEPDRRATRKGRETGRFYVVPVALLRWGLKSEARAAARRARPTFPPWRPIVGDSAPPVSAPRAGPVPGPRRDRFPYRLGHPERTCASFRAILSRLRPAAPWAAAGVLERLPGRAQPGPESGGPTDAGGGSAGGGLSRGAARP